MGVGASLIVRVSVGVGVSVCVYARVRAHVCVCPRGRTHTRACARTHTIFVSISLLTYSSTVIATCLTQFYFCHFEVPFTKILTSHF